MCFRSWAICRRRTPRRPGATKPWGTGQAVLAAEPAVRGPFAVINADDFYGASAYRALAGHFRDAGAAEATRGRPAYALVGYPLRQTLSEHGAVNRGRVRDGCGRPAERHRGGDEDRAHAGRPGAASAGVGRMAPAQRRRDRVDDLLRLHARCSSASCADSSGISWRKYGRSETAEFYLPVAVGRTPAGRLRGDAPAQERRCLVRHDLPRGRAGGARRAPAADRPGGLSRAAVSRTGGRLGHDLVA